MLYRIVRWCKLVFFGQIFYVIFYFSEKPGEDDILEETTTVMVTISPSEEMTTMILPEEGKYEFLVHTT